MKDLRDGTGNLAILVLRETKAPRAIKDPLVKKAFKVTKVNRVILERKDFLESLGVVVHLVTRGVEGPAGGPGPKGEPGWFSMFVSLYMIVHPNACNTVGPTLLAQHIGCVSTLCWLLLLTFFS